MYTVGFPLSSPWIGSIFEPDNVVRVAYTKTQMHIWRQITADAAPPRRTC